MCQSCLVRLSAVFNLRLFSLVEGFPSNALPLFFVFLFSVPGLVMGIVEGFLFLVGRLVSCVPVILLAVVDVGVLSGIFIG